MHPIPRSGAAYIIVGVSRRREISGGAGVPTLGLQTNRSFSRKKNTTTRVCRSSFPCTCSVLVFEQDVCFLSFPFLRSRELSSISITMVVVESRSIMFRFLETAAEKYDNIVDFKSDSILSEPAPEPQVTFAIGAVRHNHRRPERTTKTSMDRCACMDGWMKAFNELSQRLIVH